MFVAVVKYYLEGEKTRANLSASMAFTGTSESEVIQAALNWRQRQINAGSGAYYSNIFVGTLGSEVVTPKVEYELMPIK